MAAWLLAAGSSAEDRGVDFAHDVVPLLKQHCGECHIGDARQGGFSMNTREDLLAGGDSETPGFVEGNAGESEIILRITSDEDGYRMPSDGDPLPAEAVSVLRRWIDQNASWEPGFAFQRSSWEPPLALRELVLPPADEGRDNPVDRIVDAFWKAEEIPRPPPSDDRTFIRRASLDLVGLLPSSERVEAFLSDSRPDKRRRLIRELLDETNALAYAEHWMSFWNDLLRNDYTGTGFITGGRRQITSWLHRSLMENKPYDRFVRELISPTEESRGFIDGIVWRGTVNASQTVPIQFAQNLGQTFLGINLKCASCHDSFVDRWTLEQTYNLAAISSAKPLELHRCEKATGKKAEPAWLFPELGQIDPTAPPAVRLEQLAAVVTHRDNGWLSRNLVNRLWARLMGRGIVHPVDALRMPPWNEDLLEMLAADLVDSQWDIKHLLETICTSEVYAAATPAAADVARGQDYVFRGPLPRRMTAEQFIDAVWQLTGTAPQKHDAAVTRHDLPEDTVAASALKTQSTRVQADGPSTEKLVNPPAPAAAPMVRAALVKATALMAALGRPNRDQVVTSRPSELTTLEAIQLANEQTLADRFDQGGRRILAEHGPAAGPIIEWIFAAALARPPTPEETAAAGELLGGTPTRQGVADLLWAVVMLPEFQLVR